MKPRRPSRRWQTFKANRRAAASLVIFLSIFAVSLCAEFIANDRPLLVRYGDSLFFPVIKDYTETDFGGELELRADFHDPFIVSRIEAKGWAVWPPVRFSYNSINYSGEGVFPLPPSLQNPLGTDDQGRDILARLLYGFRLSVIFGVILAACGTVFGIMAGAAQGYFGGAADLWGQRFMEVWSGIPVLYLLIIISSFVSMSFWILLCIMLFFGWMGIVGVVRAEALRVRNLEYVTAARALGLSEGRILLRHVLPNTLVAAISVLPFKVNAYIVTLTALDFIGFGLPPGYPSLGDIIAQGKANLHAPWIGLSIFFTLSLMLVCLVFIGEGVRDAFDPRVFSQVAEREEK